MHITIINPSQLQPPRYVDHHAGWVLYPRVSQIDQCSVILGRLNVRDLRKNI